MEEKSLNDKLKEINARIDSVSVSPDERRPRNHGYLFLFVFLGVVFSALLYLGISTTGFVTFSESVYKADGDSFSVASSSSVRISTDLDSINALLLSGVVHGKGKAAVFLERPDRKYLAYYFEGDASSGVEFRDMCYDTCHVDGLDRSNTLLFELSGTSIDVSKVTYLYSRIIDFALEPLVVNIDYSREPASIVELRLTNRELADYSVLLYVDGPLSSSFSWQGSLIHMTKDDPEKIIPITVKLPSNLPKGTYTNKITARYVPPGTYDFVGESPVAESFITIENL
jgi:hypothetical protein